MEKYASMHNLIITIVPGRIKYDAVPLYFIWQWYLDHLNLYILHLFIGGQFNWRFKFKVGRMWIIKQNNTKHKIWTMKYSKHSFTRQYSVLSDSIQANEPRTRSQNLVKIPKKNLIRWKPLKEKLLLKVLSHTNNVGRI